MPLPLSSSALSPPLPPPTIAPSAPPLRTAASPLAIPSSFRCPLTSQVMHDPVATSDGQVYERSAIEEWLRHGLRTSPLTGLELESRNVIPQPALRAAIEAFMLHPSTPAEVATGYAPEPGIGHQLRDPSPSHIAGPERESPAPQAGRGGHSAAGLAQPCGQEVEQRRPLEPCYSRKDHGAEVRRLLDGLQAELLRAKEDAAANASTLVEPIEIARQVLSSSDPQVLVGPQRAAQRIVRCTGIAEHVSEGISARSNTPCIGIQHVRIQPPVCESSAMSKLGHGYAGGVQSACRESSPTATPKSNGGFSSPVRADPIPSPALGSARGATGVAAATTTTRTSPERQRRSPSRAGSPAQVVVALTAADTCRDSSHRRPHSRSPSEGFVPLSTAADAGALDVARSSASRLPTNRGTRRGGSPGHGGWHCRGPTARSESPTAAACRNVKLGGASTSRPAATEVVGMQWRTTPRRPGQAWVTEQMSSSVAAPASSMGMAAPNGARPATLGRGARPASPGSSVALAPQVLMSSTPSMPRFQRGVAVAAGSRQKAPQSPPPGNRSSGALIGSARHMVPSPARGGASGIGVATRQRVAQCQSPGSSQGGTSANTPAAEKRTPLVSPWSRPTLVASPGSAVRQDLIPVLDEAGRTPLMHAAREGNVAALQHQIASGTAVDAIDECRCTALMYAATYGHVEAVLFLVEQGAAVEATSQDGWTPLITAAYSGHVNVVRCLLANGANIEAADERGWTSLMHVAFSGDSESLQCLLEHRANIGVLDSDGRSALAYAALNGHTENVRCLLQDGDRSPTGTEGAAWSDGQRDMALLFAAIHGRAEVVRLLLGGTSTAPETRRAALKLAADHGHAATVVLLQQTEKGAAAPSSKPELASPASATVPMPTQTLGESGRLPRTPG